MMKTENFYRSFEDKHRGSRELIKNRLKVYLPFIMPLKKIYDEPKVLDIGCGRGEWLELLKENGITSKGIDFDNGMLEACRELELDVIQGDGIEYLKTQADNSISVVTTFHVIEHISFEQLQLLIFESLRVLKPLGLLIMETPNPQNIKVATENFYMDPTHTRPIPSQLLLFLSEYQGFKRSKIIGLQERNNLKNNINITLSDVIGGVSPDYAVVTQKSINEDSIDIFKEIFQKDIGVTSDFLFDKFESRLVKLEAQSEEAIYNYKSIINSRSWKITRPLRILTEYIRVLKTYTKNLSISLVIKKLKNIIKKVIKLFIYKISSNSTTKKLAIKTLSYFPKLKIRLKKIASSSNSNFKSLSRMQELEELSPQAKKIYKQINKKMDENKGKL